VAPWGFELASIARPVLIVHGRDDHFVGFAHGEWLHAHVPGSEAWIDDAHGHLSLFEHAIPSVNEWLLAAAGRSS
jgi:pimeloyl-ACP methyl ester carboxylesterase